MTTKANVDRLRAALEESTQGEWVSSVSDDGFVMCKMGNAHEVGWDIEDSCPECFGNMDFIALAHNEMPTLLDHLTALEAENKRLREANGYLRDALKSINVDATYMLEDQYDDDERTHRYFEGIMKFATNGLEQAVAVLAATEKG